MNRKSNLLQSRKSPSKKGHEFWSHHIEQMHGSALSRAAYCRKHGLNYDRASYWKKRLDDISFKKLLPVKIEPFPIGKKTQSQIQETLCQLHLSNGAHLDVRSLEALELLLDKIVNNATFI